MTTTKLEENCIHGRDMVEDYGLSHKAIKAAKRTCWGANTEMQVFAIGVQHGLELGILECIDILKKGDWNGLADQLETHLKTYTTARY